MPKIGEAQDKNHPWKKRINDQVQVALARKAATGPKKKQWTCPSCGDERCAFEECLS